MYFTVRKNHDVELAIYLKNDVEMFCYFSFTFTMQCHNLVELMTNISYIMTKVSKFYGVSLNLLPKKEGLYQLPVHASEYFHLPTISWCVQNVKVT